MMKRKIGKILLIGFAVVLMHCNAAEDGFNAPTGSSVTTNPKSVSFTFPATGSGCVTSSLSFVTFQIFIPIGTKQPTIPEVDSVNLQPGNEIQGVVVRGGDAITLYRFKDGVETFLPQASLVDVVPAGTFAFVTNERGLYSAAFTVTACYDSEGELITGSGAVSADIGVTQGVVSVTIAAG